MAELASVSPFFQEFHVLLAEAELGLTMKAMNGLPVVRVRGTCWLRERRLAACFLGVTCARVRRCVASRAVLRRAPLSARA